jgi:coenzyme F420-reducing hydrogenase beta subunit
MENIILYKEKRECNACGACMNVCPKNAITLVKDKEGFLYPEIDDNCIHCSRCIHVCTYHNDTLANDPIGVYAAQDNSSRVLQSSSGGVFIALASQVINGGGVVYGCAYSSLGRGLTPIHIKISDIDELYRIQGSKYAQSNLGYMYKDLKEELETGKQVLFSGTPCQIAACRLYLNKEYKNLLLVDIVCHGVPSADMFESYITYLENKKRASITDFCFRDKSRGWGLCGKIRYEKNNHSYERVIDTRESSYYSLFLSGDIYRESCYSCNFACKKRVGDISIGDYWGIENEHPDYLENNGGKIDVKKGVSCILVNTEKGMKRLEGVKNSLVIYPSEFEKVAKHNGQLKTSSKPGLNRERILELYKSQGYSKVDSWYWKQKGMLRFVFHAWYSIPESMRYDIKQLLKQVGAIKRK